MFPVMLLNLFRNHPKFLRPRNFQQLEQHRLGTAYDGACITDEVECRRPAIIRPRANRVVHHMNSIAVPQEGDTGLKNADMGFHTGQEQAISVNSADAVQKQWFFTTTES